MFKLQIFVLSPLKYSQAHEVATLLTTASSNLKHAVVSTSLFICRGIFRTFARVATLWDKKSMTESFPLPKFQ